MKTRFIVTGKTEESYLREGIQEYRQRIQRYIPFDILEIPALRNASSMPAATQMQKESDAIRRHLLPGECLVLLDERGKEMTSAEFAAFVNKQFTSGYKGLAFVIGGPFGFDPALKKDATHLLSLSRMTFSHQMVRLFFTEQLYRALTILRGESYHHE